MNGVKHVVEAGEDEVFDVELDKNVLEANAKLAEENARLLREHGVVAVDVMGAIGSGKTSLISKMVEMLKPRYDVAAVKGDLTTTIDAEQIQRHGATVVAINTGKECHLDANLLRKALQKIDLEKTDLLFIENVGNLICPAEFPLGSQKRVVVVSVTEGPYIAVKHPYIFMDADVAVINKADLAEAMEADVEAVRNDILKINPEVQVVVTNCRSGEGVSKVVKALKL